MSLALKKENYFWHKVQSLTGIIPVGFYMLQHLVLNSYSLAGPEKFNGVISFFDSIPWYVLLTIEVLFLWLPLAFHAVYGLMIINRAEPNNGNKKYDWTENWMYLLQRVSGIVVFLFLVLHIFTTTGAKYATHSSEPIMYSAWHTKLASPPYIWLIVYLIGIAAASYHLAYGVWNFCIRWGITISTEAQDRVQRFSWWMFVVVTVLGWAAILGFLRSPTVGGQGYEAPIQTGNSSSSSELGA